LLRVAHALSELTDGFALLELAEAEALRREGLGHPILLLEGFFSADELPEIARLGLTPVIHKLRQLQWLEGARLSKPIPVYLKINTGMNRLGLAPADLPQALARLVRLPQVAGITLMSHFAEADGERGIAWQLERFRPLHAGSNLAQSLANSATLLRYPEAVGGKGDWARPGIVLYGASPFPEIQTAVELGLRPAMTLTSEIIAVQDLRPGERVGYGGLFEARHPMRIGVVACGYGDGYPRHTPTGTPIAVAGRRSRTLGRVSMDMLVADLTNIPEAGIGAPVILWGGEGEAHVPVDEVARAAGTVAYELFCALAPRVPVLTA
jgi:alanine racemase